MYRRRVVQPSIVCNYVPLILNNLISDSLYVWVTPNLVFAQSCTVTSPCSVFPLGPTMRHKTSRKYRESLILVKRTVQLFMCDLYVFLMNLFVKFFHKTKFC